MFKHRIHVATASLLLLSAANAMAEDAPAAPPAAPSGPSISDILTNSGIAVSGYIDASYEYSPSWSGQNTDASYEPGQLLSYRVFDQSPNSFAVNQAALTIAKQPTSGFGGLVNVIYGRDAEYLPGSNGTNFSLTQAFVQYATGAWTLQAGKFLTLAGAEVIAPTGNTNSSRSLLFFAEPLTHTGVRATFAASDTVSVIFGINNGWASGEDGYAPGTTKTGELGVSVTPNKIVSFSVQGYYGTEKVDGDDYGTRALLDGVVTVNATSALSVVGSIDWGSQKNFDGLNDTASYYGAALYLNWQINDNWRASLRGEYVNDSKAYFFETKYEPTSYACNEAEVCGYAANKVNEETLTIGYAPTKSVEFRLEGRVDSASLPAFYAGDSSQGADGDFIYKKTQSTIELEALYKFGP
jgi:Putative beta-barrel porin-2, OmpL-like. bbp2